MLLLFFAGYGPQAQQAGKGIRIADTLSVKERSERNPLILRSELDSLIKLYAPVQLPVQTQTETVESREQLSPYILAGVIGLLLAAFVIVFILYRQRKETRRLADMLQNKQALPFTAGRNGRTKNGKRISQPMTAEEKMEELCAELSRLEKENASLNGVIREYNGIRHEYDSLKQGLQRAYKIKNYPGYDRTKDDVLAMKTVLDTEKAVADYAYEKFLKPVLSVADANKNNPSKMSAADKERMIDLLLSLSFLYIEYLYLRVSELSVGGTIVERIKGFSRGNSTDMQLLKKLNMEAGSRALVMRLALNKAAVDNLSYPVFDETNLNNH